jgi:hypothetical protein
MNGTANDLATRRTRLERLLGTDETRGTRGDLARARAAKAAGFVHGFDGRTIDEEIARLEAAYARLDAELTAIALASLQASLDAQAVAS